MTRCREANKGSYQSQRKVKSRLYYLRDNNDSWDINRPVYMKEARNSPTVSNLDYWIQYWTVLKRKIRLYTMYPSYVCGYCILAYKSPSVYGNITTLCIRLWQDLVYAKLRWPQFSVKQLWLRLFGSIESWPFIVNVLKTKDVYCLRWMDTIVGYYRWIVLMDSIDG